MAQMGGMGGMGGGDFDDDDEDDDADLGDLEGGDLPPPLEGDAAAGGASAASKPLKPEDMEEVD